MSTLTSELVLEESQFAEARQFRRRLSRLIARGQNEQAWFAFFQELSDTILVLGAEGYDLTYSGYVQDLLAIGRELFGYDGQALLDELCGGEDI